MPEVALASCMLNVACCPPHGLHLLQREHGTIPSHAVLALWQLMHAVFLGFTSAAQHSIASRTHLPPAHVDLLGCLVCPETQRTAVLDPKKQAHHRHFDGTVSTPNVDGEHSCGQCGVYRGHGRCSSQAVLARRHAAQARMRVFDT